MILVKIELHPGGDETCAQEIGRIVIANVSGLAATSNYRCHVETTGCADLGIAPVSKQLTVKGHHRASGVLKLLSRVLNLAALGEDI